MKTSTSLNIPNNKCNSPSLVSFDLSAYKLIERIEIGNENFYYSKVLILDGLYKLELFKIGSNSFTQLKSTDKWDSSKANNQSKSFRILNCESLESIQIGEYSFSDFAGDFELKNLPQLQFKLGIL